MLDASPDTLAVLRDGDKQRGSMACSCSDREPFGPSRVQSKYLGPGWGSVELLGRAWRFREAQSLGVSWDSCVI